MATFFRSRRPLRKRNRNLPFGGQSASFTLTATVGTFAVTGVATSYDVRVSNTVGTFAVTGIDAIFREGTVMPTTVRTYTLTGNATTFGIAEVCTVKTYTDTHVAATFGIKLAVDKGTFTLTGNPANLITSTISIYIQILE